jgi:hypothetical protein
LIHEEYRAMLPVHLFALLFPEVTAEDAGATIKRVPCERCGAEYHYQLRRTAKGSVNSFLGIDDGRAATKATTTLLRKLDTGCEPVPCPKCGWYQQDMIRRARRMRHRWMLGLAVSLFPISIFVAIGGILIGAGLGKNDQSIPVVTLIIVAVAGLALLAAPGLPIARFFMIRRYDPNYDRTDEERESDRRKIV